MPRSCCTRLPLHPAGLRHAFVVMVVPGIVRFGLPCLCARNRRIRRLYFNPAVSLLQGLVTLFVMIGLGIVFGLPYLVARNRRLRKEGRGGGGGGAPSALANIMELTRKRGHVN